jgi:hypothetical protein
MGNLMIVALWELLGQRIGTALNYHPSPVGLNARLLDLHPEASLVMLYVL